MRPLILPARFTPSRRMLLTGAAAVAAMAALREEALASVTTAGAGKTQSAAPASSWVWDQSSPPAGYFTFSPDGLTATRTAVSDNSWGTIRMVASFTTGRRVCELLIGSIVNEVYVGVQADGANNTFVGNDGHSFGVDNNGAVSGSGGTSFSDFSGAFYAGGQTAMIADDATGGFGFVRSSAQATWTGSPGTDTPDVGSETGGFAENSKFWTANMPRFFAASMKNSTDFMTIHPTPTQAIPTGYSA